RSPGYTLVRPSVQMTTSPPPASVLATRPTVEHPLDHLASAPRDPSVLVAQLDRRRVERPGQAGELLGLRRQRVAGSALDEEPPVPRPLTEPVGVGQDVAVVAIERAGAHQLVERGDRPRAGNAVLQLQELRGELDVGERATAQLEVELCVVGGWDA